MTQEADTAWIRSPPIWNEEQQEYEVISVFNAQATVTGRGKTVQEAKEDAAKRERNVMMRKMGS